jgi:hypothetical protein
MKDYRRRFKAMAQPERRDWFRIVNKADDNGDKIVLEQPSISREGPQPPRKTRGRNHRSSDRRREAMPGHAESRSFVPAMGVDHLLPFYDIVARLASVKGPAQRRGRGRRAAARSAGARRRLWHRQPRRHHPVRHPDVVVGVDPDERALNRARRKARRAGLAARFDHGYAQQLPYPDASFDGCCPA